jgi:hypothetical protein
MADTLPEFLLHWAERTPEASFVGEPDRDRTYTYGQVTGAVARFRARLRGLGVTRGDRVAVLGDNSGEWGVARRRVAPDVPGVRPRPRRQARGRDGDGAVSRGEGSRARVSAEVARPG